MKSFLKILTMALTIISPLGNNFVSATPTNEHIDLIEPGLILNDPIAGATDCSNTFSSATLAELNGCIKSGIGPAIENNHNNIINNYSTRNSNTNNINKLGEGVAGTAALTSALSALPQSPKDSQMVCGLGSSSYSSKYAIGFGCASKVSERIDVNAGGSYVFGGSKSYGGGTLDSSTVKAGFVFKLGALKKPTQISFKDKKIIDNQISILQEDNKNLQAEVEVSKAKNEEIISLNQKLLARLEKLENIALKFQSNSEMISIAAKE